MHHCKTPRAHPPNSDKPPPPFHAPASTRARANISQLEGDRPPLNRSLTLVETTRLRALWVCFCSSTALPPQPPINLWFPSPRRARRWEPYQMAWCEKNKGAKGTAEYMTCLGRFNRDNNTWKKLDVILKHLLNNDAE